MVDDFLRRAKDALLGDESSEEDREVRPASQDPYGDPADQFGSGNITPASQDPYGDPADQASYGGQFGNVRPASEDPYGDPADEEQFQ